MNTIETDRPVAAVASLLAAEPNVASAFVAGVQHFAARCGRRRVFLSEADAAAYERGFAHWPEPLPREVASTPMSCGWWDREHQQELRDEYRDGDEEEC